MPPRKPDLADHASGQPLPEWVGWDCCDQVHNDGTPCTGAAQADYGRCLAHLDDTQLARVMSHRPDEASPDLDARGVRLASDDLKRLLAAARDEDGLLRLGGVSLGRATVKGDVSLNGATVEGGVFLSGATVEGDVSLDEATVKQPGVFLDDATVEGHVVLSGTFEGGVSLDGATIKGNVSLHAVVKVGVVLNRAEVGGGVDLGGVVEGDVVLFGANVKGAASIGPMLVSDEVAVSGAEFARLATLDVTAKRVDLSHARFSAGLTARIGDAEVEMERVDVQGLASLAHQSVRFSLDLSLPPWARPAWTAPITQQMVPVPTSDTRTSRPRLLQLCGTDVTSLTLTGVDLSACRFLRTVSLDKLHIDGSPQLAMRRERWNARRRVLAEEHVWRHEHGSARRRGLWYPRECRPSDPKKAQQIMEAEASAGQPQDRAHEISAVYRALRKGREDSKDEPGAADFYYGEMEMRRKAAGRSVEGMLLTGYWLLSGHGLRAWRAFTALVALIAVATVLFATVGLARSSVTVYLPTRPRAGTGAQSYVVSAVPGPRPGWVTALNYSVQSTTSLLRSPPNPPPLTGLGQVLEIFLRFAGPGLLALAVLALRARVKR